MPDSRETIIRLDYDSKTAEIWTMQRGLISRLQRIGGEFLGKPGPGVWVRLPLKAIHFRNPGRKTLFSPTAAHLAGLAKAQEVRRRQRQAPEAA